MRRNALVYSSVVTTGKLMPALRLNLIVMPFASAYMPSLGLTQLRGVVGRRLNGRVIAEILYLNIDVYQKR